MAVSVLATKRRVTSAARGNGSAMEMGAAPAGRRSQIIRHVTLYNGISHSIPVSFVTFRVGRGSVLKTRDQSSRRQVNVLERANGPGHDEPELRAWKMYVLDSTQHADLVL